VIKRGIKKNKQLARHDCCPICFEDRKNVAFKKKNRSGRKEAGKRLNAQKVLMLIAVLFTMPGVVFADTATTNFTVAANVEGACKFSTNPGNIDFGSYDTTSTADNVADHSAFRYKCANGTTYRVYITRTDQMLMGADSLSYELYSNAARTTVFPATAGGVVPKTSSNNGQVSVNIYGKIPNSQDVLPGVYTETDIITIEY
jgi:spore coat protein U-like protein